MFLYKSIYILEAVYKLEDVYKQLRKCAFYLLGVESDNWKEKVALWKREVQFNTCIIIDK